VAQQLDTGVQVLVAVASDLPEAYVIFETLNDRGADLTTADLLKSYLFSQAKQHFSYVESQWIKLDSAFEDPEDLVNSFVMSTHLDMGASPPGSSIGCCKRILVPVQRMPSAIFSGLMQLRRSI
jgi:hypothetical protein